MCDLLTVDSYSGFICLSKYQTGTASSHTVWYTIFALFEFVRSITISCTTWFSQPIHSTFECFNERIWNLSSFRELHFQLCARKLASYSSAFQVYQIYKRRTVKVFNSIFVWFTNIHKSQYFATKSSKSITFDLMNVIIIMVFILQYW